MPKDAVERVGREAWVLAEAKGKGAVGVGEGEAVAWNGARLLGNTLLQPHERKLLCESQFPHLTTQWLHRGEDEEDDEEAAPSGCEGGEE